jgi:ankyrin repeat protein
MDIHDCCQSGDLQRFRELIGQNIDLNEKNLKGETPLHVACTYGRIAIVEELLKYFLLHKVHLNDIDQNGWTPLHCACVIRWFNVCKDHQLKIIQMLIDHGADVNAQTDRGYTPLHLGAINNNFELVKVLLPYSDRSLTTIDGKYAYELGLNISIKDFIKNYQDFPEIKEPDL